MIGEYTATDHFALAPALMLALFGCAALLFEFLLPASLRARRWTLALALTGELFAARTLLGQHAAPVLTAFHGALTIDPFARFFNWLFLAASVIVLLMSYRYLEIEEEHHAEFYGLILLAQCGMFFLAAGTDLVTIFVALELLALASYVLVGFLRADRRSNEAALKYFLLGGFSSGFLIYGFSILYAIAGSTNLAAVAAALTSRPLTDPLTLLALAATSVGLLFKVAAAPFHMWAPDAYEGAPTPATAFLSVAAKTAAFAILFRVLLQPLGGLYRQWLPLIAVVAVLSLTVGNLAALTQTNLKRLVAYSSIGHAGYVLLGIAAHNETGLKGVAVYLLTYLFANLGLLLVVAALRRRESNGTEEELDDIAGLAHRHPAYAALMLVFLLSLAGIPPTAGFLGKYYILWALVESGQYALAAVAALYVAVAAYYYFRVARSMYASSSPRPVMIASSAGVRAALALTGAATVGIGLWPEPFLKFAGMTFLR